MNNIPYGDENRDKIKVHMISLEDSLEKLFMLYASKVINQPVLTQPDQQLLCSLSK